MLIKHITQCLAHGNKCSTNGDYHIMVMTMIIKDLVISVTAPCSLALLINTVTEIWNKSVKFWKSKETVLIHSNIWRWKLPRKGIYFTIGTIHSILQFRKSKYVKRGVASCLHLTVYECIIHPQCLVFKERGFCCYFQYYLYTQAKDFSWYSTKEARIWFKPEENNRLCWAYADTMCLYIILNKF